MIWRNNTIAFNGILESKYISLDLTNWQEEEWFLGKYNLTLVVNDEFGKSAKNTTWITIKFDTGDAYADEFISTASIFYYNSFFACARKYQL